MIQSTWQQGLHVALIMDGNGRWATRRGLPRSAGHKAGAEAVRRVVRAAPGLGVGVLTLYAFSSDNWQRPRGEVDLLMQLFRRFLRSEARRCRENGVRINIIGRRDRLSLPLRLAVEEAEKLTAGGDKLLLRIAVDYSARDAIARVSGMGLSIARQDFSDRLQQAIHSVTGVPDVDLMIRTGEERRLSDFLLWECAYAELYFTSAMWPDFDSEGLASALADYGTRNRRFGAIESVPARRAAGAGR